MPPVRKRPSEKFPCDEVHGERFYAHADDLFKYNWWEVFCFPYILCSRFWEFCVSLCAGTNQCLVYWMVIQWVVCKITRLTTPDPIIFPYFFYMFCQVILLTLFFALLWHYFGYSVLIPYFYSFYIAMIAEPGQDYDMNFTRLSLRKYCFKKSEIFDTSTMDNYGTAKIANIPLQMIALVANTYWYDAM